MKIPFAQKEIEQAIVETVRVNRLEEGYIRPLAYIGYGEMGLYVKENPIRLSIAAWPWGRILGKRGSDAAFGSPFLPLQGIMSTSA